MWLVVKLAVLFVQSHKRPGTGNYWRNCLLTSAGVFSFIICMSPRWEFVLSENAYMSINCLGYLPRRIQFNDSTWKSLDVQYKVNVLSYNIIILRPFSLQIQTCMEILESILLYTAEESQLANRLGVSIVQRVLQGHMKLLYSCLNPGNPPEVIKAALKLLTAMVTQGSSAAREVQSSFDFTLKSLGALPNKRDSNVSHCTV